MKIAIPVNNRSMESGVSESFGRAPYFLFYDTEVKSSVFIENSAATSPSGTGNKAAQIIIDYQADACLTPRCGQKAADVLKMAKIKLFQTTSDSIKENVAQFMNGELPVLEKIHAGYHRHGK